MEGSLNGYRLRSSHGDTIDPRQPLPTDSVKAQEVVSVSPTITYNGKASAGAISINSLTFKPISSIEGDQVASYWGNEENKVYSAFADGNPKKGTSWLTSVTETASSAAITIYDPDKNLEEMFESVTGTVKRFVCKVYDKTGGTLYGWVRGISVSGSVYTFEIMNNRLTETQSWVGTLSAFDNANLEKVEIYHYNTSLTFSTGTTFTEEVGCPKEYSKSWEKVLEYAQTLSNGQYFVDYMRARVVGVKADTTAIETVTYNIRSSTSTGVNGSIAASVIDVNVSNPPQTSSSFSLISSAQTLTGSFADVGGEINVANKNFIHFRVTLNINSATDARFKFLSKGTSGGATECTMDHSVITGTNCSVAADDSYIEQDADADQVFLIRVPLDRSVNYLQLQSMTAGGTADATLDAVTYTLGD